jgi:hypothetical protein
VLSLPGQQRMFLNKRDSRSLGHSTWVLELPRSTFLPILLICKLNSVISWPENMNREPNGSPSSDNRSYFIAIMGRRTLYILCLAILDALLLLIGVWPLLGVGGRDLAWAKWAQAVTQMVFYGCYTAFIGRPLFQLHESVFQ